MGIDINSLDRDHPLRKKVDEKLKSERIEKWEEIKKSHTQPKRSSLIQHTSEFFTLQKVFYVTPMGKPRMTQQDKWRTDPNHPDPKKRQRKVVTRYYKFKNTLRSQVGDLHIPQFNVWMIFFIPMPKSWTQKKTRKMVGMIHDQTPDTDNILKAMWDSLYEEDKHFADIRVTKIWCWKGQECIEIYF